MLLYVAGPMAGYPELNHLAFYVAEEQLVAAGYEALNPARHGGIDAPPEAYLDYLILGLRDVEKADGVALLPGWHASRGANVERVFAVMSGKPVTMINYWIINRDNPQQVIDRSTRFPIL